MSKKGVPIRIKKETRFELSKLRGIYDATYDQVIKALLRFMRAKCDGEEQEGNLWNWLIEEVK